MVDVCEFQKEHIEILADLKARIKSMEIKVNDISDMKENLKVLTILQQKQELRDTKFDKIYEEQIKTNTEVTMALKNINTNLEVMNEEIKNTNNKVESLEEKFNDSEKMNIIDIREINQEKTKLSLKEKAKRAIVPTGAISGLLVFLYEVVKNIKIGQ